jgi:hypothetical protein
VATPRPKIASRDASGPDLVAALDYVRLDALRRGRA